MHWIRARRARAGAQLGNTIATPVYPVTVLGLKQGEAFRVAQQAKESAARFGKYRVVREVGKGGMGCVLECTHPELARRVALKVMHGSVAASRVAVKRFEREAKSAAQIRHQHVVEVFDLGSEAGVPFMVMPFLEGANLASLLREKGALPLAALVEIFLPVLSAVATAHAAGIIHRDLKPANVMLCRRPPNENHPMVLDFGISKSLLDDDGALTRSEAILGTLHYMAPELTNGARFATQASDQYALGVMLYECATAKRPFDGEGSYALMHAIMTAPVVAPSQLNPSLPKAFDALVLRAMHKDPKQRFESLSGLACALLELADARTWTRWHEEFLGVSPGRDLWVASERTEHDAVAAPNDGPSAPLRSRALRFAVAVLGAYAVGSSSLLFLQRPASEPVPADVSTASALELPVQALTASTPSAVVSSASVSDERVPVGPAAVPSVDRAASTRTWSGQRGRSAEGRGVAAEPPAPARSSPLPSAPALEHSIGTNGAVIVE